MFFEAIPGSSTSYPSISFRDMLDSVLQNLNGRQIAKSTGIAREYDDYENDLKKYVLGVVIAFNHYGDYQPGQPGGDPVDNATQDVIIDTLNITSGDTSFYNVMYAFHHVPKTGLERETKNGLSLPVFRNIRLENLPVVRLSGVGGQARNVLTSLLIAELEDFPTRWGFNSDKEVDVNWQYNGINLTATVQLVQSKPEAPIGKWANGTIEMALKKVSVTASNAIVPDPIVEEPSTYAKVDVVFDNIGNSNYLNQFSSEAGRLLEQMFMLLENRMIALETRF